MAWDPKQYLRYADHRQRPAVDLMARIEADTPNLIYDLGCGPGTITRLLAERWPNARIVGVDSSPEMLVQARAQSFSAEWIEADLATWTPDEKADIVFSNATLQWLNDHETLLPALLDMVAPGGVLAVQMPHQKDAPSHVGMEESVAAGPWREMLTPLLRHWPVLSAREYWELLAGHGARADIWEVEYLHVLEGEDAVVEWTKGTGLRPLLAALTEPWRGWFLADYTRRMNAAYPRRSDGFTLFPFKRLFLVARKPT